MTRSGTPPKDFSAEFKAQKGDDVVEISIGEIIGFNLMNGEQPLSGTGIGVRYTVPRR